MKQSEFFKAYGQIIISVLKSDNGLINAEIMNSIKEKIDDIRIIELEEAVVERNWEDIYNGFTEEEREEYDTIVYD